MLENYTTRPANQFWDFEWKVSENPVVFFSNPKVKTNVIYTLEILKSVLLRSDKENMFIPVPRDVMQNALDACYTELNLAA